MKQTAFDVYSFRGVFITTVYFDSNMGNEEVKARLVNHDGYSSQITLKRRK